MKIALISILLSIAAAVQVHAQHLVQTLSVSLVGYKTDGSGKAFVITARDVIRYFIGTNVPNGQLQLVTPTGNPPGGVGNLNAFLRVTQRGTNLMEISSPDRFNLFQDTTSTITTSSTVLSRAINRFSIDFAYLHAELQGFSTWTIRTQPVSGHDLSGSGTFVSTINGIATVDGFTQFAPVRGTIVASAPKFEP
jgi:hypothetical protein